MPGFDGTGPAGMGPMTGGGRGFCAVPMGTGWYPSPAGRGRGRGRGFRNWYRATGMPGWMRAAWGYPAFGGWANPYASELTPAEETRMLKEQSELLKQQMEDIQVRIRTLEKAKKQDKK